MKATAADSLPEGREWLYEVKWDGYRALAAKHGREVRLLSMKNKPLTPDFPGVVEAVRRIRAETALLDGEIVALDPGGKPSFQALQNRGSLGSGWEIAYYAFDLLNLDGEVLTGLALETRRAKLRQVLAASGVRFSAELTGAPGAVAEAARAAGLEGIIAKRRDSAYRAGTRVETWRKLKLDRSQEFVLGGFNPNGETFQSLLAGYYEAGRLLFAGKVRQGFTPGSRARLMQAMGPHVSRTSPFANLPSSKKGNFGEGVTAEDMKKLIWLRPRLVAQCAFTEWTRYGLLRHATFLGLREDKDPREVRREVA